MGSIENSRWVLSWKLREMPLSSRPRESWTLSSVLPFTSGKSTFSLCGIVTVRLVFCFLPCDFLLGDGFLVVRAVIDCLQSEGGCALEVLNAECFLAPKRRDV